MKIDVARWNESMPKSFPGVKSGIIESIRAYVLQRRPTGDFLREVLSNHLIEALGRADMVNRATLPEIVKYAYWHVPESCWGSPEKVKAWLGEEVG